MTTSFSSILDSQVTDTEIPKALPTGSYTCQVKGLPRFDKSSKKQTEFVEFNLYPFSAGEDVDPEALEEALGDKSLTDKSLRATYYLTPDSLYRLKQFLEHCGIEIEGKSYTEAINEVPGSTVVAHIKHRFSDDGERVFAEIKATSKA